MIEIKTEDLYFSNIEETFKVVKRGSTEIADLVTFMKGHTSKIFNFKDDQILIIYSDLGLEIYDMTKF